MESLNEVQVSNKKCIFSQIFAFRYQLQKNEYYKMLKEKFVRKFLNINQISFFETTARYLYTLKQRFPTFFLLAYP